MAGAITQTVTRSQAPSAAVRTLQAERLFYVIAGIVMLIASVGMWAAIWDCSRDAETRERANRRCTSAGSKIPPPGLMLD